MSIDGRVNKVSLGQGLAIAAGAGIGGALLGPYGAAGGAAIIYGVTESADHKSYYT